MHKNQNLIPWAAGPDLPKISNVGQRVKASGAADHFEYNVQHQRMQRHATKRLSV